MRPKSQDTQAPQTPEFEKVIQDLAIFTAASNELAVIESEANMQFQEVIDEHKAAYAAAQLAATQAEAALEAACRAHPEWFATARSIKTPWGKVAFRKATHIEVTNAEATCKLLRHVLKPEDAAKFIRQTEEPDKEALETFSDDALKAIMCRRVTEDEFKAIPAKIDFGKAVKESQVLEAN